MTLRWLLRLALLGLVFAFFHLVLDRLVDPALLRGLEIAAVFALATTLTATGAATGAGRIDVEGRVLDWLLYAQLTVLICITFRLLGNLFDNTVLRGSASVVIVSVGGSLAGVFGSILATRHTRQPRRTP